MLTTEKTSLKIQIIYVLFSLSSVYMKFVQPVSIAICVIFTGNVMQIVNVDKPSPSIHWVYRQFSINFFVRLTLNICELERFFFISTKQTMTQRQTQIDKLSGNKRSRDELEDDGDKTEGINLYECEIYYLL